MVPRNKVASELLHHRLIHISNRSFMDGDTEIFWKDIELRIYPVPFFTSRQISSMNKKARSKNILKLKEPLKWVFGHILFVH